MEKADQISCGHKTSVTARQVQERYRGYIPSYIHFTCPICKQPLFPAAMKPGAIQSPHFRHEKNNPQAQECEKFAATYGCNSSAYQQAPMPMFLRESRGKEHCYIVEIGFRPIKDESFEDLAARKAAINIGTKKYFINEQRFNKHGLTVIPLDNLSLKISNAITLEESGEYKISELWGDLEDPKRCFIFARGSRNERWKRLHSKDPIPYESELCFLAPKKELEEIEGKFTNFELLGEADSQGNNNCLFVAAARFTKNHTCFKEAEEFLRDCGFSTEEYDRTPQLIWPPSLQESGASIPLFKEANNLVTICTKGASQRKIFLHTPSSSQNEIKDTSILSDPRSEYGVSSFAVGDRVCIVSTKEDASSSSMILSSESSILKRQLPSNNFQIEALDNDTFQIQAQCPMKVINLNSEQIEERKIHNDQGCILSTPQGSVSLVVHILHEEKQYKNCYLVFEQISEYRLTPISDVTPTQLKCSLNYDIQFAQARLKRSKLYPGKPIDIQIAERKKSAL